MLKSNFFILFYLLLFNLLLLSSCSNSIKFSSNRIEGVIGKPNISNSNSNSNSNANKPIEFDKSTLQTTGLASYYADKFVGRMTANGEIYSHDLLTAAHRTLPFGTYVKVTNIKDNSEVIVRINDRGPFVDGRIIDLSKEAARKLNILSRGVAEVIIEIVE